MIGVIGAGNLASALVRGWGEPVFVTDSGSGRAVELAKEVEGTACELNSTLAKLADLVVLCHKPQQLLEVAAEVAPSATVVISTLARVTLQELQEAYPNAKVARVMPSIAAELGKGITVVAKGGKAQTQAVGLFARVGDVVEVDEDQIEAATAIAGVGPAYVAAVVEAWSEAGARHGLSAEQATAMAVASVAGGAALIGARDNDAAAVREAVSSPGGVTLKGLAALDEAGLKQAFENATEAVIGKVIFLADTRGEIANYVQAVALVYAILIIASIVVQIAFDFGARVPYYRWSDAVFNFLRDVSQPYLSIFRRFIPMLGPLDLSPIVALLVLGIGSDIIASLIAG